MGFKGFEIESTEAKSTVNDLIKDLSEEEWDWIEMDLEEVKALTFMKPLEWSPKINPRPNWRIEEIQNQTQKEGTPTKLGEAEAQTKQISAEIVELTGSKETGQSNNQKTIVQEDNQQ